MKKKKKKPFGKYFTRSLEQYFHDLDGIDPTDLHDQMTQELEKHLFEYVMKHTTGNRTRAAAILGVSRSTLRKKLDRYNISPH